MMMIHSFLAFTLVSSVVERGVCCSEREDLRTDVVPSATVPVHQEPYDITPYADKTVEELDAIATLHSDTRPSYKSKFMPYTCFPDENWKIRCNIFQELIRRYNGHSYVRHLLDNDFVCKIAGLKTFKYRPPSHVFFYWKQAAWVNPDYAEGLAYSFMHGFQDKIAPNPDWAPYWTAREKLLRESKGWYIPYDKDDRQISQKGLDVVQKIRIMLATDKQV